MKIVVLDGYLVGLGGIDWAPVSRLGEFLYYGMTTQEDDVFCADPCGKDNPLACHPKGIATPHVAWMPTETRQRGRGDRRREHCRFFKRQACESR